MQKTEQEEWKRLNINSSFRFHNLLLQNIIEKLGDIPVAKIKVVVRNLYVFVATRFGTVSCQIFNLINFVYNQYTNSATIQ